MLPFAGPGDGKHTERVADDQTSTVRGDAELIARAGHLFDAVHEEFACAARDMATWSQPEARSAVARRVLASGTDSFTVRKLMSPLALADEAAARRLGTSLRTYRRRVAELMAALEVGSRFQAGMRAGELGLGRVAS